MRVIAGGTGLIGKRLVEYWLKQNHTISVIGRTQAHIEEVFGDQVTAIAWDKLTKEELASAELLVNLTGASVGERRWTKKRKDEILSSRIDATKKIVSLLSELDKPVPLFNASAIGVYGLQKQLPNQLPARLDEDASIDWSKSDDFMALVGRQWEQAARVAETRGTRVIYLRFGVVLAREGGALPEMMKAYRYYMGGPIGSGDQPFSWVAIDDVIDAIDFLAAQPKAQGPYNIVAPECVRQAVFSATLAKVIHKPNFVRMPAFLLQLMFGEMARDLLLDGQHVCPKRLSALGFKFLYPELEPALAHVLRG